jgi:peptide deformylase
LRAPSIPIGRATPEVIEAARRMGEIMHAKAGIGLAGPQVGFTRRLIVINTTGPGTEDRVFVDPRISARRGAEMIEEGCLSFPGLRVQIRRPAWIRMEASALDGTPVVVEADDLLARALQHEIDHLDGVLLVDRMSPADRRANLALLRQLEARQVRAAAS